MKTFIEILRDLPLLVGAIIGGIISIILIANNTNPNLNIKIAYSQYDSLLESKLISESSKSEDKRKFYYMKPNSRFYYIRPNVDNICLLGKNDKIINLLKGEIYSEFDHNIKKIFTCEYLNKNIKVMKEIKAQEDFHFRIFLITLSLTSLLFYFLALFLRRKKSKRGE